MPLYDYRCDRCSTQFEVRQSFNDDTLAFCPTEGSPAACTEPGEGPVRKVFTGVGIAFKGDGFYKNDHGSNAHGRRKERESSSPKDSSDPSKSSEKKSSSDKKSSDKQSSSDSTSAKTDAKAGAST